MRRDPRVVIAILLILAAVAVVCLFKVRVMVAGFKAVLALVALAILAWLLLSRRNRQ